VDNPVSQWFYAESSREHRGPVPREEIAALFHSGHISADTLVWRQGLGDWQPLRGLADELGLHEQAAPPVTVNPASVPPLPPPMPSRSAHPATAATRKPGMSGWTIFGIIAAVVGVGLLAIVGVLAAIAFPAYQEYVSRARLARVEAQLAPLKVEAEQFVLSHQRCPNNGDEGFGTPESYASGDIAQVNIGDSDEGLCGLEARLHMPDRKLIDGKSIWLDYDTQSATWACSSDVADKHLPLDCRG